MLKDAVLASRNSGTCGALWGAVIGDPDHGTYNGNYIATARASRTMKQIKQKYESGKAANAKSGAKSGAARSGGAKGKSKGKKTAD